MSYFGIYCQISCQILPSGCLDEHRIQMLLEVSSAIYPWKILGKLYFPQPHFNLETIASWGFHQK